MSRAVKHALERAGVLCALTVAMIFATASVAYANPGEQPKVHQQYKLYEEVTKDQTKSDNHDESHQEDGEHQDRNSDADRRRANRRTCGNPRYVKWHPRECGTYVQKNCAHHATWHQCHPKQKPTCKDKWYANKHPHRCKKKLEPVVCPAGYKPVVIHGKCFCKKVKRKHKSRHVVHNIDKDVHIDNSTTHVDNSTKVVDNSVTIVNIDKSVTNNVTIQQQQFITSPKAHKKKHRGKHAHHATRHHNSWGHQTAYVKNGKVYASQSGGIKERVSHRRQVHRHETPTYTGTPYVPEQTLPVTGSQTNKLVLAGGASLFLGVIMVLFGTAMPQQFFNLLINAFGNTGHMWEPSQVAASLTAWYPSFPDILKLLT